MPANTIREQTFCCGSGSGLNAGEDMELRMAGGLPRANAVKHVMRNMASTCWPPSVPSTGRPCRPDEYWVPEVDCHRGDELVANALIMPGEQERTTDLRGEPLPGMEDADE
jgi:hypothetical protein